VSETADDEHRHLRQLARSIAKAYALPVLIRRAIAVCWARRPIRVTIPADVGLRRRISEEPTEELPKLGVGKARGGHDRLPRLRPALARENRDWQRSALHRGDKGVEEAFEKGHAFLYPSRVYH
jgi:hypothetical protein